MWVGRKLCKPIINQIDAYLMEYHIHEENPFSFARLLPERVARLGTKDS
jgi:hypothetical protein